ncbi:hydrogenase formation protein HypD [Candidatus Aerophobetes bacterium Ae_b3a]|nr:MAG: hydrogenase formation protein HypD [Candidatus Aerophobetes bacterium Ae_b3a]
MKYLTEFRQKEPVRGLTKKIKQLAADIKKEISLMEVCGTHTMAVFRYGIKALLPKNLHLLSGPGCPVCVTANDYIDKAIAYAHQDKTILVTFGDIMKVPGSRSSLSEEASEGAQIRVVYSSLEALEIARKNPSYRVIFLGIGFETTAPTIAASILMASEEKISNYLILSGHKIMPPAMRALVENHQIHIDGFLCPGHVSAITGSKIYEFLAREYRIPCVVAGFEPLDILESIRLLLSQIRSGQARVENEYRRAVTYEGNLKAQQLMEKVFSKQSASWRGIGKIPQSGLKIRKNYASFDVEAQFPIKIKESKDYPGCICGDILRGLKTPPDCSLFKKVCSPSRPLGACMVSSEGTCAAYYKYHQEES